MADVYWDNVVLAMPMDGEDNSTTFIDLKGHTVTRYGDARIKTTALDFGGAAGFFDGIGGYITITGGFNPGPNNFTVEFFYTPLSRSTYSAIIVGDEPDYPFCLYHGTSVNGGDPMLAIGPSSSAWFSGASGMSLGPVTNGLRYHIAIVRDGDIFKVFKNGIKISEGSTDSAGQSIGNISNITFCKNSTYYLSCYIDVPRITEGVARYTEDFTPPTTSYFDGIISRIAIFAALQGNYGDAEVVTAAMIGLYSMIIEQAIIGRYGNASVIQAGLVGRYADAAQIQAALIGRYGDMVPVLAALEGRYHLMHAVLAGMVGKYAICGSEVLAGLVGRYDLKERNEIIAALEGYYSLLSAATIAHITCPVRIGGVAVRWSSVSWTISEDSYLIEATITLRDAAEFGSIAKMDTVEIDWGGVTYQLFVAAKLRSRSVSGDVGAAEYGAEYTIVARSLSAGLDAPYALPVTMSWPVATLASEIAADLIASLSDILTLDFRLEDWLQPGGTFFLTDESPLDGLRKLAAIVGGIVQTSPGNAIILRMTDSVPPAAWATTSLAWTIEDSGLFSDSESEADSNHYNVITVTNQSESNSSTRFEVEDISKYRKRVRGYRVPWDDFDLATSGGSWVTIEDNGVIEHLVVDELVEFIDGSASSTKPIYSQVAVVWQQVSLGGITAAEDGSLSANVAGNSLAKITYATRYHEWIVTSDRIEEVQFYEVEA